MRRTATRAIAASAVLAAVLTGCSGGGGATSDGEPDAPTTSLRDVDEVEAEQASDDAIQASIGEPVALGDGVTVTITEAPVGGDEAGPWLEVTLRVENGGDESVGIDAAIVCAGSDEGGGWQAGSTFDPNEEILAGTFQEGTLNLLLPDDSRTGEVTPECEPPAVVRVGVFPAMEVGPTVDFALDAATSKALNAARVTG